MQPTSMNTSSICALSIVVLLSACDPPPKPSTFTSTTWTPVVRVNVRDKGQEERLGHALVMAQDHALVSSINEHSKVYALKRANNRWTRTHHLPTTGRPKTRDDFGRHLILHQSFAAVAAPRHTEPDKSASGAVHIYARNTQDEWRLTQQLKAPKGTFKFGSGLAYHKGRLWVGSSKSIMIFEQNTPNPWSITQTLTPQLQAKNTGDFIRITHITSAGDDIIALASIHQQNVWQQRLYIYRQTAQKTWAIHQTLHIPSSALDFSHALAANHQTIAVGGLVGKSSQVQLFQKTQDGQWNATSTLKPNTPQLSFGRQITCHRDDLYISTQHHLGKATNGVIYRYHQRGGAFKRAEIISSKDKELDNFGTSFAISGDELLVGATPSFNLEEAQHVYHFRQQTPQGKRLRK